MLETDTRPWGKYEVLLDADYCKVKRIIVKPKQRLSYQKHFKREEVWTIVQGTGTVTLDDVEKDYSKGSIVRVGKEVAHRMANKSDNEVVFIEVQMGDYFGEDDIVRLEDDYGRKN